SCRTSRRAGWPCRSRGKPLPAASRTPGKTRHQRGSRADTADTSFGPPDSRAAGGWDGWEVKSLSAPRSNGACITRPFLEGRSFGAVPPICRSMTAGYAARASPSKGRRVSQRVGNTSVGQIPLGPPPTLTDSTRAHPNADRSPSLGQAGTIGLGSAEETSHQFADAKISSLDQRFEIELNGGDAEGPVVAELLRDLVRSTE